MGRLTGVVFFAIILFSHTAVVAAEEWTGNVNFQLGSRQMKDTYLWGDLDNHTVFGVNIDFGKKSWVVHPVIGISASSSQEKLYYDPTVGYYTATAKTSEFSVGVLKNWEVGNMRPFLSAGMSSITGKGEFVFSGVKVTIDDSSTGFFFDGGVFWRLGKSLNLGFDYRILTGTSLNYSGVRGDADYTQFAFLLGFGW